MWRILIVGVVNTMTVHVPEYIERLVGQIYEVNKLSEQGCTSEV